MRRLTKIEKVGDPNFVGRFGVIEDNKLNGLALEEAMKCDQWNADEYNDREQSTINHLFV